MKRVLSINIPMPASTANAATGFSDLRSLNADACNSGCIAIRQCHGCAMQACQRGFEFCTHPQAPHPRISNALPARPMRLQTL